MNLDVVLRERVEFALSDLPTPRGQMIALDHTHEVPPERPPSTVAAIVALVAVLVFVIGPLAAHSGDPAPETPSEQTGFPPRSVSIGDAMVSAIGAHDAIAATNLLSDDAIVVMLSAGDAAEFIQLFAWFDATRWRFWNKGCEFLPPNQVMCAVLQSNAWSEVAGVDPVHGTLSMSFTDNLITSISYSDDSELWAVNVVDPFLQFVKNRHFHDIASMWFLKRGQVAGPMLDDDAVALFTLHTAEYVGWAEPPLRARSVGDAMLRALDTGDVTAATSLLSDDAVVVVLSARNPAEFDLLFDWLDATEWRFRADGCEFAPPKEVTCDVLQSNAWSRTAGVDAVEGRFSMLIDNGLIRSISYTKDRAAWTGSVVEPFLDFVTDRNPDDISKMWNIAGDVGNTRLDAEAVALFRNYTADYRTRPR